MDTRYGTGTVGSRQINNRNIQQITVLHKRNSACARSCPALALVHHTLCRMLGPAVGLQLVLAGEVSQAHSALPAGDCSAASGRRVNQLVAPQSLARLEQLAAHRAGQLRLGQMNLCSMLAEIRVDGKLFAAELADVTLGGPVGRAQVTLVLLLSHEIPAALLALKLLGLVDEVDLPEMMVEVGTGYHLAAH